MHKLQPDVFDEVLNDIKNFVASRFRKEHLLQYVLRFVLSDTSIYIALVGTSSPAHLPECLNAYRERPTDPNLYERIRRWYQ